MTIIGVEKDTEAWFLGIREGVDTDNLEGLKVSGGPAGDRNITVGEKMLEDLGVDPESHGVGARSRAARTSGCRPCSPARSTSRRSSRGTSSRSRRPAAR